MKIHSSHQNSTFHYFFFFFIIYRGYEGRCWALRTWISVLWWWKHWLVPYDSHAKDGYTDVPYSLFPHGRGRQVRFQSWMSGTAVLFQQWELWKIHKTNNRTSAISFHLLKWNLTCLLNSNIIQKVVFRENTKFSLLPLHSRVADWSFWHWRVPFVYNISCRRDLVT